MLALNPSLLRLAVLCLSMSSIVAIAGIARAAQNSVEIVGRVLASGHERVLASGPVANQPQLLATGDRGPVLFDRCGTPHGVSKDQIEILAPSLAVQGLRHISAPDQSRTYGLYENGALVFHRLTSGGANAVSSEPVPGWSGEVAYRTFVPTHSVRKPKLPFRSDFLAVDPNGTLFSIATLESGAERRQIGPKGAFQDATHLVLLSQQTTPGTRARALFHTDERGRLYRSELARTEQNRRGLAIPIELDYEKVVPVRIGDFVLGETRALDVPSRNAHDRIHHVDAQGKVSLIDVAQAKVTEIGELPGLAGPNAFRLLGSADIGFTDPVTRERFDALYVRTIGRAQYEDCADKKALLAAARAEEEKNAQKAANAADRAIALMDAVKAAHADHYKQLEEFSSHWIQRTAGNSRISADELVADQDSIQSELERWEKDHLAPASEAVAAFREAYPEMQAFRTATFGRDYDEGNQLNQLEDVVDDADAIRPGLAAVIVQGARTNGAFADAQDVLKVEERKRFFDEAIDMAKTAFEFVADDSDATATIEELESQRQSAIDAFNSMMAQATWPTHTKFHGPQDVDTLAAEGLAFANARHDDRFIDAKIYSNWAVDKRNRFDQIVAYSFGMHLVRPHPERPDLAIVSEAIVITEGPAKAAPFDRVLITDIAFVPLAKAPADVAVPSGSGSGRVSGALGLLFRIVLSGVLLCAGLLMAGPFLIERVAALGHVVRPVASQAMPIGFACLGVALLGFLGSLISLSPLAHLLPLGLCSVVGLMFYREWPGRQKWEAEGDDARTRAIGAIGRAAEATASLAPHRREVGLACLSMGALHLVLGGFLLL